MENVVGNEIGEGLRVIDTSRPDSFEVGIGLKLRSINEEEQTHLLHVGDEKTSESSVEEAEKGTAVLLEFY